MCDFNITIPININDRVNWAVEFAWDITICKIVNGEIEVNKEASLQLHYSIILKNILELLKFSQEDRFEIKLETTEEIDKKSYIVDILLKYTDGTTSKKHSIELKCYKTLTSSGKPRGAQDIFMKDVYLDLYYSELYLKYKCADYATCLILTDHSNFINPKTKKAKNWHYDISNGYSFTGGHFKTPIGGKEVNFKLEKSYKFNWQKNGNYWVTLIRPE
jgi:hypothetical protein